MRKKKKKFFPIPIKRESPPAFPNKKDDNKNSKVQLKGASIRFSGPLPPPEILEHYNSISPGLADRIVQMAETQAIHRQFWKNL